MSGLYLVRHGETAAPGRFLGASDPPLSDRGREQAHRLAATMPVPRRIVSSGLRRAMETAAILANHWGLEASSDPRWNEISYGAWDGLQWDEIERRWPEQAAAKLADWWGVDPPGGESAVDFAARLRAAWADVQDPRPVVVIAHAGVNALVHEFAQGRVENPDWARITEFQQGLGEWVEL